MNHCYVGDCRTIMADMIRDGVQVQSVITSPPYYGLRDYGVKRQIGLEQTLPRYIKTMVGVFRLVRELLRKDGTCWINMGDSWAGSPGGFQPSANPGTGHRASRTHAQRLGMAKGGGKFKHKDLMMVPARLAIALQEDGWFLRQQIIWHKPNCMPESHRDRFTNAHEYVFLLAKSRRYYFDQAALMEKASEDTHARYARGRSADHKHAGSTQTIARGFEHMAVEPLDNVQPLFVDKPVSGWATGTDDHSTIAHNQGRRKDASVSARMGRGPGWREAERKATATDRQTGVKANDSFDAAVGEVVLMRKKRSVWTIPSEGYADAHFATYPRALVEHCIAAGSRVGDLIFDPFHGSGTTGQVAQTMGRQWLACELNPAYMPMQRRRAAQLGLHLE